MTTTEVAREALKRERSVWGVAAAIFCAYLAWDWYWSADQWYVLDRVYVADTVEGVPAKMAVDRTIEREFSGAYTVTVRALPKFTVVCSGGSNVVYRPGSALPGSLTFDWWSYGAVPECTNALKPGKYEALTCVTIHPDIMLLGNRKVCRTSNVFTVAART
mgnify:CR=1 FL=1